MYRRPGPESHSSEHTKGLRLTCSVKGFYEEHTYGWQEVESYHQGVVRSGDGAYGLVGAEVKRPP